MHIGTGGHWGPKDFTINREVQFQLLENAPFYLRKKCPPSVVPPAKVEMLPTSLLLVVLTLC